METQITAKTLTFFINDEEFRYHKQYISGAELKALGSIPADWTILLAIKRPWDDEIIEDHTEVDLAREGIERFITRKPHHDVLVDIFINDIKYEIKRGKYTVSELKKIGKVPSEYELDELIHGKLVDLDDNATILIKGAEEFFGHVRGGSSS
jgi:hypothetical protein